MIRLITAACILFSLGLFGVASAQTFDPSVPYGQPPQSDPEPSEPVFDPSVPYGYPSNYGESAEPGSGYSGSTGSDTGSGSTGSDTGSGSTVSDTGDGGLPLGSPKGGARSVDTDDLGTTIELFNPLGEKSIGDIFLAILDIIMVFAVPIILFFIVWAGFLYVTAGGSETQLQKAHRALLYAVIGGLLALGAHALLFVLTNTIEVLT